jgi:3-hydroxyisobutyrate dehydrogenase-like beta-hydroxyacid dehydrogenase
VDVGFVGTGRMGGAMVRRLLGAGHQVVAYNRTSERAAATGASVVATPRDAAGGAAVVFVSLADDAAVDAAYRGPDGIVAGLAAGAVVVDTSTVAPQTVRTLGPLVADRGAELLDGPVSGSVSVVERGELTVMAGGDAAALDRVRPALSAFASKVFHVGELGTGATVKLVVNSLVFALNQAVAEALVLAEKAGIDRAVAYEIFTASAVAAPFVHYKRGAFERPDETPPAFSLDLVAKDLSLIDALASSVGARMEQLATNRRIVSEAVAAGLGDADLSAIAQLLRGAT